MIFISKARISISVFMIFFVTNLDINLQLQFLKGFSKFDFKKVLNHSLVTAPVSLFDTDGSARKTSKNKLAPILMSKSNKENADASEENTMYVVDLMALMRVVMAIPETFEDLALMLTSILPNQRISTSRLGCKLLL